MAANPHNKDEADRLARRLADESQRQAALAEVMCQGTDGQDKVETAVAALVTLKPLIIDKELDGEEPAGINDAMEAFARHLIRCGHHTEGKRREFEFPDDTPKYFWSTAMSEKVLLHQFNRWWAANHAAYITNG